MTLMRNLKASAKAKLMAGEPLTEEEADTYTSYINKSRRVSKCQEIENLQILIAGGFTEADIPNLSASKITTGTLGSQTQE